MFALLRHSLRQLSPVLSIGSLGVVCILMLVLAKKEHSTGFPFFFAMSSPLVFYSPALLYSPKCATDFWLPVRRGTLYHVKMAVLCLIVGLSYGVPMLVIQTVITGEPTMEIVRVTITLVSWLTAGVCVSAVAWPAVYPRKVSPGLDFAMCVGCAFLAIAYAAVEILIILGKLGGFWLAPCVLTISFFAYRKAYALFCEREQVPPVPEEEIVRRLDPERRAARITSDLSKYPYARVPDLAEFLEAATGVRRVRSKHTHPTPLSHPDADTPTRLLSRLCARIPQSWRLPLRMSLREALPIWLFLYPFFLWQCVSLPGRQPTNPFLQVHSPLNWWLLAWPLYASTFGTDWCRLINVVPGAYPRRRLFAAIAMWPVVWILFWSMVFGLLSAPGRIAAVAGLLAVHSLLLWLRVTPPPRHAKAWLFHRILVRACPIALVLISGLWLVGTLATDSFAARLFQELGARVSAALADPSQAWFITGILALAAVIFWGHAYLRFKYMEVVPPRGELFSGSWYRKWHREL